MLVAAIEPACCLHVACMLPAWRPAQHEDPWSFASPKLRFVRCKARRSSTWPGLQMDSAGTLKGSEASGSLRVQKAWKIVADSQATEAEGWDSDLIRGEPAVEVASRLPSLESA